MNDGDAKDFFWLLMLATLWLAILTMVPLAIALWMLT